LRAAGVRDAAGVFVFARRFGVDLAMSFRGLLLGR
jgi:hypothetical protein